MFTCVTYVFPDGDVVARNAEDAMMLDDVSLMFQRAVRVLAIDEHDDVWVLKDRDRVNRA
jgi:hypothetical protein